jgi:hypothetical protein
MTLVRAFALGFAVCGLPALALAAGCGGSIVVVGDGGPTATGSGDDGGGSSGGQSSSGANGGNTGGVTGSTGGTGTGTPPVTVDPCPTDIPTPGAICREPGHGCAYITTDSTGTTSCYPVLCDQTGHWQASTTGCQ